MPMESNLHCARDSFSVLDTTSSGGVVVRPSRHSQCACSEGLAEKPARLIVDEHQPMGRTVVLLRPVGPAQTTCLEMVTPCPAGWPYCSTDAELYRNSELYREEAEQPVRFGRHAHLRVGS